MEFAHKLLQAYSARCFSLCQKIHMPQTAFDILLFLANNPKYNTARDIVELRGIKANLVSVNVDKLVRDGYLKRQPVAGDRRKIRLAVTKKAQPVVEIGRSLQAAFLEDIFRGIDDSSREAFYGTIKQIQANLEEISEGCE